MPRAGSAKRKKQEQAKKNFARSSVKIEMGPAPPRKVPSKKSAFPTEDAARTADSEVVGLLRFEIEEASPAFRMRALLREGRRGGASV